MGPPTSPKPVTEPNPSMGDVVTPVELLGPLNDVELKYAPKRLYVAGRRVVLNAGPRVAIVGSRRASRAGLLAAASLARTLVRHGATVVSGLAEGIDTAAHQAAIQAGGRTIAVLGTPLDRVFPARNRDLQDLIQREHLALSQFGPGHPVLPKNFILRNRTMALVAHASVIVEAGNTSGALSQGWETLRLGHPLFLQRTVVDDPRLTWPRKMLDYGAVILGRPSDLLAVLPSRAGIDLDVAF